MNRKRSVWNMICSIGGQVVSVLTSLVLTRLLLVRYGSATNGLITSVNQIFAYFILLEAGIGSSSLQALYGPVARKEKGEISRILVATKRYYDRPAVDYFIAVVLFAIIYPLAMCASAGEDGINVLVMAGVILFIGLGNVINFIFQGKYKLLMQAEGRNYLISNLQGIIQILSCLLKAIGILLGYSVVLVMALGFVASLVQAAIYAYYIRRDYRWIDFAADPFPVGQKKAVMIHQTSQLIFQNTDVIILTIFCGLKVVSVYAAYKVVVSALNSLCYNLSESVLFLLGQGFATNREEYIEKIDRFDLGYTMVSFALFSVAYVLYLPFIALYTSGVTDISYIDVLLPGLFIGIELLSGCRRAMQNTINVAGHFQETVRQTVLEMGLNLTISLFGVWKFGMRGVLMGTIVALLYRSNEIILYGNHKILGRSAKKSYCIYAMNAMIFGCVVGVAHRHSLVVSGYGGFFVAGVIISMVIGIVYIGINWLFFSGEMRALFDLLIKEKKGEEK